MTILFITKGCFLECWAKNVTTLCTQRKHVLIDGKEKIQSRVPAIPLWAGVAGRVWGQWSIKLQTKLKVWRRVAGSNHPLSEAARIGYTTLTHSQRTALHILSPQTKGFKRVLLKRPPVPNRSLWNYFLEVFSSVILKFPLKCNQNLMFTVFCHKEKYCGFLFLLKTCVTYIHNYVSLRPRIHTYTQKP